MKASKIRLVLQKNHKYIGYCGGVQTKKDRYTIHHIVPVRNGGKITLFKGILLNCAVMTRRNHDKFNLIENEFPLIAEYMNDGFESFNQKTDYSIIKDNKEILNKYYPKARQLVKVRQIEHDRMRRLL